MLNIDQLVPFFVLLRYVFVLKCNSHIQYPLSIRSCCNKISYFISFLILFQLCRYLNSEIFSQLLSQQLVQLPYTKPPLFGDGSSGLVYSGMLQNVRGLEHAPLSGTILIFWLEHFWPYMTNDQYYLSKYHKCILKNWWLKLKKWPKPLPILDQKF